MKRLLKLGLASSPGWRLAAPLRRRGVVVLAYHRINAGQAHFPGLPLSVFRRQMEWVRKNCTPIRAEDMGDAVHHADAARPPVVVTFDDGYRDYHDHAYPVLRQLDIPATVFLTTDCMDRGGLIWTESLHWAAMTTRKPSLRLPWRDSSLPLRTPEQRQSFVAACKIFLKAAADGDRRAWLGTILERLEAPSPEASLGRQMLSWDEVRATRDGTSFGGHTHTHPILAQTRPVDMEWEIRSCRERILAETGEAPLTFAYPNGKGADFNDLTRDLLRRHGFRLAFSTIDGVNGPDCDFLALRRSPTGGRTNGDFATLLMRSARSTHFSTSRHAVQADRPDVPRAV